MNFFRDHIAGIAILAVTTGVTATFVYDYFDLKPLRTFFSKEQTPIPGIPQVLPGTQTSSASPDVSLSIAPSFDCKKTTWNSERIVCSSQQLAVLDLAMSNAYRDAAARSPNLTTELRVVQNQWLRKIRELCTDVVCMRRIYERRIAELKSY